MPSYSIALIIFSLLGLIANLAPITLFFGVDFLLGSITAFLVLRLYGIVPGVMVALIVTLPTYQLWGHPYFVLLSGLQLAVVGMVLRYRTVISSRNLPTWLSLYLLVLGLPLIFTCYHYILGLTVQGAIMISLKQGVNEIFNALIATLALYYLPLPRWLRRDGITQNTSLEQLQGNLLVAFALLTALVLSVLMAKQDIGYIESTIKQRLYTRSTEVSRQVEDWRKENLNRLVRIAAHVDTLDHAVKPSDLNSLRVLANDTQQTISGLRLFDQQGHLLMTSEQADDEKPSALNFRNRPWFHKIRRQGEPLIAVVQGYIFKQTMVVFATPSEYSSDKVDFTGGLFAAVKGTVLNEILSHTTKDSDIRLTLINSKGVVIASSFPGYKSNQEFDEQRGTGLILEKNDDIYLWSPMQANSAVQRWSSSFFTRENTLPGSDWTLVTEFSLKPHFTSLQQKSTYSLLSSFAIALLALMMGHGLSRQITTALKRLGQATTGIADNPAEAGKLQLEPGGLIELQNLGDNFQRMGERLAKNNFQLLEIQQNLEQRVEERTADLELYRLMIEKSADPIFLIDIDEQARLIYVNEAAEHHFGKSRKEILQLQIPDWDPNITHEEIPQFAAKIRQRGHSTIETTHLVRGGLEIPVEVSINPIQYKGHYCHFGYIRDISQRKSDELELLQAKKNAEESSRAKSDFVANMSHELRTPMNAILGFSQLIQIRTDIDEEIQDNIHEILKAGNHLLTLINEVLDLSKIESGKLEMSLGPVELEPLIKECLMLMDTLIQNRQIQVFTSNLKDCVIRADNVRLKQVLLNLLSNAIKYNREGGQIKLIAHKIVPDRLCIDISDTGKGVPAERLDELFQPFNRLDEETSLTEGTGIGLTLSRKLVELMDGRIDVVSKVDVGTTVSIEFPLDRLIKLPQHDEPTTRLPAANETIASTLTTKKKVLYIEDNPANLKLVKHIFCQDITIELIGADTPQLGIDLAATHKPELILLDINLPGMNGYEVLKILKKDPSLKDIPVIAITANAMQSDIKKGYESGFDDYLTKPLNIVLFKQTINKYLDTTN
jgi:PAS domain S-box-containing protein